MPPRAHRRNCNITTDDKQRVIDRYLANEDFVQAAIDLGIKRTTAYSIIRQYMKKGGLDSNHQNCGKKYMFLQFIKIFKQNVHLLSKMSKCLLKMIDCFGKIKFVTTF